MFIFMFFFHIPFMGICLVIVSNDNDVIYCHENHHTEILHLKIQRSHKNHRLIYLHDIIIDSPIYCHHGYRATKTRILFQVTTSLPFYGNMSNLSNILMGICQSF